MSRPERGVRYLLEITGEDEREARYALTVFTPSGEHRAEVRIATEGGDVRIEQASAGGDSSVLAEARALAKTLYNQRRADERGRWKRRLMRWREG
jgi:hypothetical protein